ncbi:BglG family transcription antiterminator [Listeria cossartiae subsp. cayugensis]|uniref:BglG family transcription antiterminator n=1 Tax=Listeria cossartiae subsp. cayugensis TaxID=2713505 RepID=A0ABU2ISE2_9LIST|nr:BglG family transcription antiterminator [Listeria cossartiae]MDT0003875.1 BglG family transcription antiterminator [Listeria cossartiae subsp. cayugensis]MDT0020269.1 BglG family transcription antiterminator [Listeria cossartiae subsp. cayugensis]MDT0036516.1 BglG family transcription antiterminator [Listeria cossartiae subsp. cayugensis]MDT0042020.1 BglG family transcription antiterminator [Listeria cossartiae subsp. cayugensis]MDT0047371.1 BglG family transcription antiterminator [Lister
MVQFDARNMALLESLVVANVYLAPEKLQEELGISKRTLQYDVEKINKELDNIGLDGIQSVRGQGYYLLEEEKPTMKEILENREASHKVFSASERRIRILFFLLVTDARVIIDTINECNEVSRNTSLQDIKQLKLALKQFNLELIYDRKNGNMVLGDERSIRQFFIHYCMNNEEIATADQLLDLMKINPMIKNQELFPYLDKIFEILAVTEKKIGIRYTDEVIERIGIMIFFFKERMKRDCYLNEQEEHEVDSFHIAQEIYEQLQQTEDFSINHAEITYLGKLLLGASRLNDDAAATGKLDIVVEKIIAEFERLACVNFEDHRNLKKDLLLHLQPAYYRLKFQIEWINPLRTDIKQSYSDVYEITKKSLEPLEELLGETIPEDEIAYVTILFGGYLSRKNNTLVERKKLLIVCSKGVGTSRMIERQLSQLLGERVEILEPISIREFEKGLYAPDFIVSTLPIMEPKAPVFIVSPILTEAQKQQLMKAIAPHILQKDSDARMLSSVLDVVDQYAKVEDREKLAAKLKSVLFQVQSDSQLEKSPSLDELLPQERIIFKESVTDWQEAIQVASKSLQQEGYISKNYQHAMIENIEKLGPYIVIAPGIALPHASVDDGAYRVGMSLLRLDKPVSFSSKAKDQVKLIIVLASIDSYTHINALSQLTNLIMKHHLLEQIEQAESAAEIAAMLTIK